MRAARRLGLLVLLFVLKLFATTRESRLGLIRRHLLTVAVHGRDDRRRVRSRSSRRCTYRSTSTSRPSRMVGMGGMVGGGTGAAMTAVVMIFEMTLDY